MFGNTILRRRIMFKKLVGVKRRVHDIFMQRIFTRYGLKVYSIKAYKLSSRLVMRFLTKRSTSDCVMGVRFDVNKPDVNQFGTFET